MCRWIQRICGWIKHSSWKSNEDISLAAIQDGIILTNSLHLKFRLANFLTIGRPLKQLSKVSLLYPFQDHLFRNVSANYYQSICGEALLKFHAFSIFFEHLPRKHTTCILCWNDVETFLSTSFQRGIHVVCL